MRNDLWQGRVSPEELRDMLEKKLADRYGGISRDVARKARNTVLSELEALNSRQTPTNDK
jgi:hypothetical protein